MAVVTTCQVAFNDSVLLGLTTATAYETKRPVRPLQLQALLQLPRLADERGDIRVDLTEALLAELSEELPLEPDWFVPSGESSPRSLRFQEVPLLDVWDVMNRFHYLRSPRVDGRAYCLRNSTSDFVAICVSSPLDAMSLRALLKKQQRPNGDTARVLSRVFAFEGAPRNTLSYLLAHAAQAELRRDVTDFVTYVNPNMGFTGTSYRAAGWSLLGVEGGTTYRYLDDRYITERALAQTFGLLNDTEYRGLLGKRLTRSVMPLTPLLVFHRQLS